MADLTSFYNDIFPYVPDCPEAIAKHAIRRTVADFLAQTFAWWEDTVATRTSSAGDYWIHLQSSRYGEDAGAWAKTVGDNLHGQGQVTRNVALSPGGGMSADRLSDESDYYAIGYRFFDEACTPGSTQCGAVFIAKDSTPSSTRTAMLRVKFKGSGTDETHKDMRFDTATGEFNTGGGMGMLAGVGVEDFDANFWRIHLAVTDNGLNDTVQATLYPAVGVSAAGGTTISTIFQNDNKGSIVAWGGAVYADVTTPSLYAVVQESPTIDDMLVTGIVAVRGVNADGSDAHISLATSGQHNSSHLVDRSIPRAHFVAPNLIRVTPLPETPYESLQARVFFSMKNDVSSTFVPDDIYHRYSDVVADGALYRLMSIPKKPYSDTGEAQRRKLSYKRGVMLATSRELRMGNNTPLYVTIPAVPRAEGEGSTYQ